MNYHFTLGSIIGLKVITIRGIRGYDYGYIRKLSKRKKNFKPDFILFDDKKTYIELEEQDYHSYHDCCESARSINVKQSKEFWKKIFNDEYHFPIADMDV